MSSKQSINLALAILLSAVFYIISPATVQAQGGNSNLSGNINWNGWELGYQIGAQDDGLAITNVKFQGMEVMGRGNFPAMPVFYQGDACGPYLDRLDGDLVPVPWAGNATVVSREFTINGESWYELGIREFIGQYDIYQVWYFNGNGIIDAHLFSRGLQCDTFHEHWPQWRFDFDIGGFANDQILRQTANGLQAYQTEFNVAANQAQNHGWVVQDTASGDYVEINFDSGAWNVDGTIVPESTYAKNRVAGRRYRDSEEGWHTSGHSSLPLNWNDGVGRIGYGNNESINNTDVVLWYSGYLPHSSSEGSSLWHSTGVRITVVADGVSIRNPGDQVDSVGDIINLPIDATVALGSNATFSATGLPNGLSINSNTGAISGTPNTAGTYNVTVSVNDGNGNSDSASFTWGIIYALIDADFDSNSDGFGYVDDAFRNTNQPTYASGSRVANGGFNGGGLQVILGGVNDADINGMSGGWQQNFALDISQDVTLSFRYKLELTENYEADEYSQVLVSVDGTLYGSSSNNYVAQIVGNGNSGGAQTTNWQLLEINLGQLSSGNHVLRIGGFNNKKTYNDESSIITIDDVSIGVFIRNRAPSVTNPGNQTSIVNQSMTLAIAASDSDAGDTLTFSESGLPAGLSLNTETGEITGSPSVIGESTVTISVNDGNGGTDSVEFTWTVEAPPNSEPVLTDPGNQTSIVNQSVTLAIAASDPDAGDTLTFSESGLPAGLSLNTETGEITGSPSAIGESTVTISVNDGNGGTDSVEFTWAVDALPIPLGDVNCDNELTSVDALLVLQYSVELRTPADSCPLSDSETMLYTPAGDVNNDGRVDSVDALFMLQCVVDIPNVFCNDAGVE